MAAKICAWCGQDLSDGKACASTGGISHGICTRCAIRITGYRPRTARRLLDLVKEPVFVINAAGRVTAANQSGLEMVGKDLLGIENQLGGDAFECAYAGEEGGCGKTVHCRTCAIRNVVMDTLATGKGYENVPAFQRINTENGPEILKFLISTQKLGNSILLRIDQVTRPRKR